jgi:hypothetical protein
MFYLLNNLYGDMLVGDVVGDKIHVLLLNNLYGMNLLRFHKVLFPHQLMGM